MLGLSKWFAFIYPAYITTMIFLLPLSICTKLCFSVFRTFWKFISNQNAGDVSHFILLLKWPLVSSKIHISYCQCQIIQGYCTICVTINLPPLLYIFLFKNLPLLLHWHFLPKMPFIIVIFNYQVALCFLSIDVDLLY